MIAVDCSFAVKRNVTGVQRYAAELLREFERLGCDFRRLEPGRVTRLTGLRQLREQLLLPRMLRRGDTLFSPCNTAPVALPAGVRLVVTVHCLRFLFYPQCYPAGFLRYYRFVIPRILRRADCVLTVSEYMREQIEFLFPEARGRVVAVPLGVSEEFHPLAGGEVVDGPPCWLFVGNGSYAKNLFTLCQVIASEPALREIPLKVLGGSVPRYAAGLPVAAVPNQADVRRVAAIYRNAFAVVVPSFYESFSLPVLEGFASGVPVLLSDIPAHRELAGEKYEGFFNPFSPASLSAAMSRLRSDEGFRAHLAEDGPRLASRFRWSECARRTWELLQ